MYTHTGIHPVRSKLQESTLYMYIVCLERVYVYTCISSTVDFFCLLPSQVHDSYSAFRSHNVDVDWTIQVLPQKDTVTIVFCNDY